MDTLLTYVYSIAPTVVIQIGDLKSLFVAAYPAFLISIPDTLINDGVAKIMGFVE